MVSPPLQLTGTGSCVVAGLASGSCVVAGLASGSCVVAGLASGRVAGVVRGHRSSGQTCFG